MTEVFGTVAAADFGVLGVGVMGANLALNLADRGLRVAVWNHTPWRVDGLLAANPQANLLGARSLAEIVGALARPRRLLIMIKAGAAVDEVLADLRPLLSPGDVVLDGGNSWFEDTRRRAADLATAGLAFFGCGVSGGEEGARRGPSLMPGGPAAAWPQVRDVLEAIAARTEAGPCVTLVGPDGAGHFVKMVHNGIEYGDMQLIAEAYDILRKTLGLPAPAIAEIFARWNEGPLASFLVELTARVLEVRDEATGEPLVDLVLDRAGQKGTGMWTARAALDLGVPVPTIAAALDARNLSALRDERLTASERLAGPKPTPVSAATAPDVVNDLHDALLAGRICAYAQGLRLIATAATAHGWSVDLAELARIWKGGCIIRARMLDPIRAAFSRAPALPSLLLDDRFRAELRAAGPGWRRTVSLAQAGGVPVPALAASLAFHDGYRSARLPQNLTQAQRDAFGAHTYERLDRPEAGALHTPWLAETGGGTTGGAE